MRHLLNCLRYVDLNMVRAGRVPHPDRWKWCSYDELTGVRKRYRIIDQERLLHLTGLSEMEVFADLHGSRVEERIALGRQDREAWWSEAIAVGDHEFVTRAQGEITCRQSMQLDQVQGADAEGAWILREPRTA